LVGCYLSDWALATAACYRAHLGAADGGLTEAERRIATLIAQGQINRQVATALFISETVQTHVLRIFQKLKVTSRTEVAAHSSRPRQGAATAASPGTG